LSELVRVDLGSRSYDIAVDSGNLPSLGRFVLDRGAVTHAVVVTDRNVADPHAVAAVESLHAAGVRVDLTTVDPGEGAKSIHTAELLWNSLAQIKADRKTLIVAVGGGVIGDLAGFIAATFTRGLRFVQVPTTLLAQVDSSVGGKVGVNLPTAKNMVGAFWQPLGVLIDTNVLNTLPERDYISGLAEVVKYGVILDADFFEYLEKNIAGLTRRDPAVLTRVVARCCRLKADVVERDEREETGLRAVLNYGHTYAHALETVTAYGSLLHGEAVSIGMMCAARLAWSLRRVDEEFVARQRRLLEALKLPVETPQVEQQHMLEAMGRDKKVEHGRLRFVLPSRLGHVELVDDISPSQALEALGS
jgi:3-dehydroquinate synthase